MPDKSNTVVRFQDISILDGLKSMGLKSSEMCCILQCKMVVEINKWVDINKYVQVCLHKIGARLLGKLTICIVAIFLKNSCVKNSRWPLNSLFFI